MPAAPTTPFLRVVAEGGDSNAFEELSRLPEYAAYPDGTFLAQMSDGSLGHARLTREQALDLLDFALSDTGLATLDLRYLVPAPFATFRVYTFQTRTAKNVVKKRSALPVGSGVADGEKALKRLDDRLFSLASLADGPYRPGRVFVVSRRVRPDDALPTWEKDAALPFAALADATDVDKAKGAVFTGDDAVNLREAISKSAAWRLGTVACEFRIRPAYPEEAPSKPAWAATPPSSAPPPPPRPPSAEPPKEGPPPVVAPPPPAAPPGAPVAQLGDVDFAGVVQLLKDLKRKTSGSPHGAFWNKPYAEFMAFSFEAGGGKVKLVTPGDGAKSNLVRALKTEPLLLTMPDGTVKEETFSPMPPRGGPMPAADIEKIRRWIDRGCPETGGAATVPPPAEAGTGPRAPTPAAPGGKTVPLALVGTATVSLGASASAEDGDASPTLYVACNAEAWAKLFDVHLRGRGRNGPLLADALAPVRNEVKGYDWGDSPLIVLVGPATDGYAIEVEPRMEILPDGGARLTVAHKRVPAPGGAGALRVRWAIYRAEAKCPEAVSYRDAATGNVVAAANRD
jgi:hypothetical protein